MASPYHLACDPNHGLTTAVVNGADLCLEGAPGVGKSEFAEALVAGLKQAGLRNVELQPENPPRELLKVFSQDVDKLAGWLQQVMLMKRQLVLATAMPDTTTVIDRSLAGDYSFYHYHRAAGRINETMARAYEKQLAAHLFVPPRLVIYLTTPPAVSIERIKKRGIEWEILTYDEQYYRDMDVAHRAAFKRFGIQYAEIDWSEHHPEGKVPPERAMQVLEQALRQVYGENWARLLNA